VIKLSAKENLNAGELCAEVRDIIDRLDDEKRGKKADKNKPKSESDQENEDEIEAAFGDKKSLKQLLL
jgi:hypothetical protein